MGSTLVEKILARHAEKNTVHAGEIISISVDRLLINDDVGELVFSSLEELGCDRIINPDNVFLNIDHNLPAFTVKAADKMVLFREKSKQYGITHTTRIGQHGIGHQLMMENFVQPLEIALGTDSHATMYAGIGAFSCGITASDAVSVLATGKVWMRVPETIRIHVKGEMNKGVTAKDLSLALLNVFDPEEYIYRAVEITGDAIKKMSLEGRLVIANMMAESGAKCAVFEADEKSYRYAGIETGEMLSSDDTAVFANTAEFDVSTLEPMLSYPNQVTNVHPIHAAVGRHVDQVFIGSCTNGRLEDLEQAAEILRGRKVADGTRLLITPASQKIELEAVKSGVMQSLMEAGAMILTSSCSSCAGNGPGLIGRGECCLSTTNRNFKGRMGSKDAEIYLGSAYAAAASAVNGCITDPRTFFQEGDQ